MESSKCGKCGAEVVLAQEGHYCPACNEWRIDGIWGGVCAAVVFGGGLLLGWVFLGYSVFEDWRFSSRATHVVGTVVAEHGRWRFGVKSFSRSGQAAVRYQLNGTEYAATVKTKASYSSGDPINLLVSQDHPGTPLSPDLKAELNRNETRLIRPLQAEVPEHWPKVNSDSVRRDSFPVFDAILFLLCSTIVVIFLIAAGLRGLWQPRLPTMEEVKARLEKEKDALKWKRTEYTETRISPDT
jgi:hypothetical protein